MSFGNAVPIGQDWPAAFCQKGICIRSPGQTHSWEMSPRLAMFSGCQVQNSPSRTVWQIATPILMLNFSRPYIHILRPAAHIIPQYKANQKSNKSFPLRRSFSQSQNTFRVSCARKRSCAFLCNFMSQCGYWLWISCGHQPPQGISTVLKQLPHRERSFKGISLDEYRTPLEGWLQDPCRKYHPVVISHHGR